jgi:glycosyltransferase involved in cell wall biosynthesis
VRPLRVVHIIEHLSKGGGAERGVVNLLRRLDRARFAPCVAMLAREYPEHDLAGIDVLNGERERPWSGVSGQVRLWRELRGHGVDIVHTHTRAGDRVLLALAALGGARVVVTRHNATPGAQRTGLGARLIDLYVDAWVGVSPSAADSIRATGVATDKVLTILNGIDVARVDAVPRAVSARARDELGVAPDEVMCLAVGALRREKNYPMMVHGFAAARERDRRLRLFIAGGGHGKPSVDAAIAQCGHAGAIRLLGMRDDVPRLLRACDIFLTSSLHEGLPQAVCEAMAACRPVVGTRVAGLIEAVDDGRTGVLVSLDDEGRYAAAILELAADAALRARMGAAGNQRARDLFSIERVVREYERLYLDLASTGRVTPIEGRSSP